MTSASKIKTPEQRRDVYLRLHLQARVWPDGDLEVLGMYDRNLPADVGSRPGSHFVRFADSDKYEADLRIYEAATAWFKADCERTGVDEETYRVAVEECDIPQRYLDEVRRIFAFSTDTLGAIDPRYPEAEADLDAVTTPDYWRFLARG